MKPRTAKSMELYEFMFQRGYRSLFVNRLQKKSEYRLDCAEDDWISFSVQKAAMEEVADDACNIK